MEVKTIIINVIIFVVGLVFGFVLGIYYTAGKIRKMTKNIDKSQIEKFSSALGRKLPQSKINEIAEMMNKNSFFRDLSKNNKRIKDKKKKQ